MTLQVGIDFFDNDALVAAARKAGVARVGCGFETVSEDALRQMNKKRVDRKNVEQQYRDAAETARKYDIAIHGYFMVGFNETEEAILRIASFAEEIGLASIQLLFQGPWYKEWVAKDTPEVVQQQTAYLEQLTEQGKIADFYFDDQGNIDSAIATCGLVPVVRPSQMDYQVLYELRNRAYHRFYRFANVIKPLYQRNRYPIVYSVPNRNSETLTQHIIDEARRLQRLLALKKALWCRCPGPVSRNTLHALQQNVQPGWEHRLRADVTKPLCFGTFSEHSWSVFACGVAAIGKN
jgi:hypothetical protein